MLGGYEPDEPARGRPDPSPPAPILPLFLGVLAAFGGYLLWGAIGLPIVGIVGGMVTGIVVVVYLLRRARPKPMPDDEETRWRVR